MYSNKYLLIFFLLFIQFSVCILESTYAHILLLSQTYVSHIYFGSYIFEILKVEIEERREPRVKWTFHISFDTNTKQHISRKMSLNKKIERLNWSI
jgi:hypothetical protein